VFHSTDEIIRPDGKQEQYVVSERLPFKCAIGDILERKIRDGDMMIFNRQPTLWKGSMRSKRITIREGSTLRFNVASTQAFNADFDKSLCRKQEGLKGCNLLVKFSFN
jgi:DNA-directed RNA polymerase beta' subunit